MLVPEPGCPDGTTEIPAILPWIVSSAFDGGTGAFSASIRPTVNGSFTPSVAPSTPVTTTSCSWNTLAASRKSAVAVASADTCTANRRRGW